MWERWALSRVSECADGRPRLGADSPTPTSTPTELEIFADVRGWIAYGEKSGIWDVDRRTPMPCASAAAAR